MWIKNKNDNNKMIIIMELKIGKKEKKKSIKIE